MKSEEFKSGRIGEITRWYLNDIITYMKRQSYDIVRDRLWKIGSRHSKLLFYIFKDVEKDNVFSYDFKKSIFDYTNEEIDEYLILEHIWNLLSIKNDKRTIS